MAAQRRQRVEDLVAIDVEVERAARQTRSTEELVAAVRKAEEAQRPAGAQLLPGEHRGAGHRREWGACARIECVRPRARRPLRERIGEEGVRGGSGGAA